MTVMNTNMFASGLDGCATMAQILLDFALFLASLTAEGMDSFTFLKPKTQNSLQMNFRLLPVPIEKVSFPYAVHSSFEQMGVLQVTVHGSSLFQL